MFKITKKVTNLLAETVKLIYNLKNQHKMYYLIEVFLELAKYN